MLTEVSHGFHVVLIKKAKGFFDGPDRPILQLVFFFFLSATMPMKKKNRGGLALADIPTTVIKMFGTGTCLHKLNRTD